MWPFCKSLDNVSFFVRSKYRWVKYSDEVRFCDILSIDTTSFHSMHQWIKFDDIFIHLLSPMFVHLIEIIRPRSRTTCFGTKSFQFASTNIAPVDVWSKDNA